MPEEYTETTLELQEDPNTDVTIVIDLGEDDINDAFEDDFWERIGG